MTSCLAHLSVWCLLQLSVNSSYLYLVLRSKMVSSFCRMSTQRHLRPLLGYYEMTHYTLTHTHTHTPQHHLNRILTLVVKKQVKSFWGSEEQTDAPTFPKISSFWMSTLLLTHIRVIMCAKRPKGFQSWTSAGGSIWMHCWSIKGRRRKRGTLCSEATQTECTLSLIMQAKTKRRQLVKNCLKHLLLSLPQRSSAVYFLYRYKDICAVRSLDSIMHCQNKYELLWFSCGLTWKTVKHSEHAVVPLSGSKSVFLICSPWPQ